MNEQDQSVTLQYSRVEARSIPTWACLLAGACFSVLPFALRTYLLTRIAAGVICGIAGVFFVSWVGRALRPRKRTALLIALLLLLCFPTFILWPLYRHFAPYRFDGFAPARAITDFWMWGGTIVPIASAAIIWMLLKRSVSYASAGLRTWLVWICMPILFLLSLCDGGIHAYLSIRENGARHVTLLSPNRKYRLVVYSSGFKSDICKAYLERNSYFALTSRVLDYVSVVPDSSSATYTLDEYEANVLCLRENGYPVAGWNLKPFSEVPGDQLGYLIVRSEMSHSSRIDFKNLPFLGSAPTVLIRAIELDDHACASALLHDGLNPDAKADSGQFPLLAAAEHSNLPMIRLLVEYGADVNAIDQVGTTALMWAARNGSTAEISYLLAHGANAGLMDKSGNTALSLARIHKRTEAVELLSH